MKQSFGGPTSRAVVVPFADAWPKKSWIKKNLAWHILGFGMSLNFFFYVDISVKKGPAD